MIGSTPRFLSYEAGTSLLHRLDPRTKLLCTILIVAAVLFASVPFGIAITYGLGAVVGALAYNLLTSIWRTLRPLLLVEILFGAIITVVTPGHALLHIWILVPSRDGLDLAVRLVLQVTLIVYTTSFLTITTPPLAVADALLWALGFLERFKVPVRDIIAMVAIGLTFVPLLIDEAQKVISAQRARGADLGFNAMMDERAMGALLIPLLLANLRRGEELAESMEARLYGTGKRSSLVVRHFARLDAVVGVATAIVVLSVIAVSILPIV